jgi:hypothetical protein
MKIDYKIGDSVVGKGKCNRGWKGIIADVDKTGMHWKYKVEWTNSGKITTCAARSIQKEDDTLPSLSGSKRKNVESDSESSSSTSSSDESSTDSSSDESSSDEEGTVENR